MTDYAKQIDDLIKREKQIDEHSECPRCYGPRTDSTRRYCAPCILAFQSSKLKTRKVSK